MLILGAADSEIKDLDSGAEGLMRLPLDAGPLAELHERLTSAAQQALASVLVAPAPSLQGNGQPCPPDERQKVLNALLWRLHGLDGDATLSIELLGSIVAEHVR